jgi:putative SOS response-associated peptidase YedK
MPVILSPNDYDVWLDRELIEPGKLSYLFDPLPSDELTASRHDAPDCILAIDS